VVPAQTGAALTAALAAACPAAPATVGAITTVGFETDPVTKVWTQTQTQTGVCTGTAGAIAGTPFTDTCNVGKSNLIRLKLIILCWFFGKKTLPCFKFFKRKRRMG